MAYASNTITYYYTSLPHIRNYCFQILLLICMNTHYVYDKGEKKYQQTYLLQKFHFNIPTEQTELYILSTYLICKNGPICGTTTNLSYLGYFSLKSNLGNNKLVLV